MRGCYQHVAWRRGSLVALARDTGNATPFSALDAAGRLARVMVTWGLSHSAGEPSKPLLDCHYWNATTHCNLLRDAATHARARRHFRCPNQGGPGWPRQHTVRRHSNQTAPHRGRGTPWDTCECWSVPHLRMHSRQGHPAKTPGRSLERASSLQLQSNLASALPLLQPRLSEHRPSVCLRMAPPHPQTD